MFQVHLLLHVSRGMSLLPGLRMCMQKHSDKRMLRLLFRTILCCCALDSKCSLAYQYCLSWFSLGACR